MEKLKLTKDKFQCIIKVIDYIRSQLETNKMNSHGWPLAVINAHLFVLDDLSRKMRSKLPMLEHKPGSQVVRYEINAIQALIIVTYDKLVNTNSEIDPYSYAVFKQITEPIYKKLLS